MNREPDFAQTVVRIDQAPDDPICARLSIGGTLGGGIYCTYRYGPGGGKLADLRELLTLVLVALEGGGSGPHEQS
jgi:hypothetical protein